MSLYFKPVLFYIGVVPVWITPEVGVYLGASGQVEAKVEMGVAYTLSTRAGVLYHEGQWTTPHELTLGSAIDPPPTVEGKADIKGYLSMDPTLSIYSATGPGFSSEFSLKAQATWSLDTLCPGSLDYGIYGEIGTGFTWTTDLGESQFGKLIGLDKLNFKIQLSNWSKKLYGGVVDGCNSSPPVLVLEGDDLRASLRAGDSQSLETSYRLRNTGGLPMPWSISYQGDVKFDVSPTAGELAPNEETTVSVRLPDTAALEVGTYRNVLRFDNNYTGSIGQSHLGSTERLLSVDVLSSLPAPFIVDAERIAANAVELHWTYDDSATAALRGFQVWYLDGEMSGDWTAHPDVIEPQGRSVRITGVPAEDLYFSVEAFGENRELQSAFSNSVLVPAATVECQEELIYGRYQPIGEDCGVVRDISTGLEWQRCSVGQKWNPTSKTCRLSTGWRYYWDYVIELAADAEDGFRLPTIDELETLVYCKPGEDSDPCENEFEASFPMKIARKAFVGTWDQPYWSSTGEQRDDSVLYDVWVVDFIEGNAYTTITANVASARLVRSGL